MRRLAILTGLGLAVGSMTARPAVAQNRWEEPQCELRTSHFLVNSAVLYLSSAASSNFEDQRDRQLQDASRVLRDAVNRGQEDNPAVWYLWGRYYEMKHDLAGADSTYTRAVAMQPDCAADVANRRRRMWIPIYNEGIRAYQAGDVEVAADAFRRANQIMKTEPQAFFYLGDILGRNLSQRDSAIFYFKEALARLDPTVDTDTSMFQNSTYMIGRYYQIEGELDSAATWYEKYLEIDPVDSDVISGLAQVYSALGRTEEALGVYDNILANAEAMDPFDLFDTGVNLFGAQLYTKAATAFELGLERNPYYRDGIYNLVNTEIAMSQTLRDSLEGDALAAARATYGERIDPLTLRLLDIDPLNQQTVRLRAQAYQLKGLPDSTLSYLEAAEAMPFDISVDLFQPMGGGQFNLHALITNLGDTAAGSPAVVFEFVDAGGNVIVSETVAPQELEGGDLGEIQLAVQGEGIVAWRYRPAEGE